MNARTDPDCDYVYKGGLYSDTIIDAFSKYIDHAIIVVLSGEMGVGKSNIL